MKQFDTKKRILYFAYFIAWNIYSFNLFTYQTICQQDFEITTGNVMRQLFLFSNQYTSNNVTFFMNENKKQNLYLMNSPQQIRIANKKKEYVSSNFNLGNFHFVPFLQVRF